MKEENCTKMMMTNKFYTIKLKTLSFIYMRSIIIDI